MSPEVATKLRTWLLAAVLLIVGACLRLGAAQSFSDPSNRPGQDEFYYAGYVQILAQHGLGVYPELVERYIAEQQTRTAVLPPMRATYIIAGVIAHWATGLDARASLNAVSATFSFLMLPLALLFAWRAAGPRIALGTLALMAFAPTQLFMARHALIDVVVAFWALAALWALWESLQQPGDARRLAALGLSLAVLVLTKETSFFVVCGLGALLALNRWLKFGTLHRNIFIAAGVGLLAGLAIMVVLCGGIDRVFEGYRIFVATAAELPYAIATGDGPWHRYIFELTLVSPLVVILALTMLARLEAGTRPQLFIALFFLTTYAAMAGVRYGVSLRFANLWDFPLCFLAASAVFALVENLRWRPLLAATAALVLVAASEMHQYRRIFVARNVHDPITPELLRAVDILK
ncbi:MAG: phospholipid carrier-dependent glycosyltransferase [Chthoniobacteraceae bacterium]